VAVLFVIKNFSNSVHSLPKYHDPQSNYYFQPVAVETTGVYGKSTGVYGEATGVYGETTGVYGKSTGVYGETTGVYGKSTVPL